MENRRVIGQTHARIGLSMTVFFGGMSMFDRLFSEMVQRQNLKENEQMLMSDAVAKQLHLDCGIVCEMFTYVMNEAIAQTIVQLGIDIGTVKTTATMMDAIDKAFRRQNLQIIALKN